MVDSCCVTSKLKFSSFKLINSNFNCVASCPSFRKLFTCDTKNSSLQTLNPIKSGCFRCRRQLSNLDCTLKQKGMHPRTRWRRIFVEGISIQKKPLFATRRTSFLFTKKHKSGLETRAWWINGSRHCSGEVACKWSNSHLVIYGTDLSKLPW